MNCLLIAWKDLSIRIKDRRGFILMLIMPLVLTAILGTALKSAFNGDDVFQETAMGLFVAEEDPMVDVLEKSMLNELQFVTVKPFNQEEKLRTQLKEGKVDIGVIIPIDWSDQMNEGKFQEIVVLSTQGNELKAEVIESFLTSFSEGIQTRALATSRVISDLADSQAVSTGGTNPVDITENLTVELNNASKQSFSIEEQSIGNKSVSSLQYYAAGMVVMFLLFNIRLGAKSIIQERDTETLARLRLTPVSNQAILSGKFIGTLLFSFIQFTLFFAATSLFFNVNWGANSWQVLGIGLALSIAVSGLSMLIAAIITNTKALEVVCGIGIQILALLGGSMLPLYSFPDSLKVIANVTPNHWALTSFLNIMSGATWSELLLPIAVLLFIGLISLVIGSMRISIRFRRSYQ